MSRLVSVTSTTTLIPINFNLPRENMAAIAQLGERQTEDLKIPGSIPGLGKCIHLRAEPNGFRVHLLSRSDTVSVVALIPCTLLSQANCNACKEAQINRLRSLGTRDLILLFFSDWCS